MAGGHRFSPSSKRRGDLWNWKFAAELGLSRRDARSLIGVFEKNLASGPGGVPLDQTKQNIMVDPQDTETSTPWMDARNKN